MTDTRNGYRSSNTRTPSSTRYDIISFSGSMPSRRNWSGDRKMVAPTGLPCGSLPSVASRSPTVLTPERADTVRRVGQNEAHRPTSSAEWRYRCHAK